MLNDVAHAMRHSLTSSLWIQTDSMFLLVIADFV